MKNRMRMIMFALILGGCARSNLPPGVKRPVSDKSVSPALQASCQTALDRAATMNAAFRNHFGQFEPSFYLMRRPLNCIETLKEVGLWNFEYRAKYGPIPESSK